MVVPEPGTASTRRGRRGHDFVKLWLAQGVSNLGDDVYLTALPLLAATLTRDPLPVSAVMFAEWLPWLLFALLAGVLFALLAGTRMVAEQLAGPPAGGFLFVASAWIPFAVDAVSFAASSALIAAIPGRRATHGGASVGAGRRTGLRAEIAEGLGWLFAHRVLRRWRCGTPGSTSSPPPRARSWCCSPRSGWGWVASALGCCWPARRSAGYWGAWSLPGSAAAWDRSRS